MSGSRSSGISGRVDHGHRLGPGDVLIGPEGAVREALDPAQRHGPLDFLLGPVAGDVRQAAPGRHLAVVEPGADGCELRPGHGCVWVEQAGVMAVDDTQGRHGGDSRVGPVVLVYVGEGVVAGQVLLAHVLRQQAEEDGGHLGAGDVGVGPNMGGFFFSLPFGPQAVQSGPGLPPGTAHT